MTLVLRGAGLARDSSRVDFDHAFAIDELLADRPSGIASQREALAVTCDFCRGPRARWRYPAASCDWLACDKCHAAIQADDREALLGRVMLAPVPRTLPDRYAPRFRAQAPELHEQFWSAGRGPTELAKGGRARWN